MLDLFDQTIAYEALKEALINNPNLKTLKKNDEYLIEFYASVNRWDLVWCFTYFPPSTETEKHAYGKVLSPIIKTQEPYYDPIVFVKKFIEIGANVTYTSPFPNDLSAIRVAASKSSWQIVDLLSDSLGMTDCFDDLDYEEIIDCAKNEDRDDIVTKLTALIPTSLYWKTITPAQLYDLLRSEHIILRNKHRGQAPIVKCALEQRWDLVDTFSNFSISKEDEEKTGYAHALFLALSEKKIESARKLILAGTNLERSYFDKNNRYNLMHALVKAGDLSLLHCVLDKVKDNALICDADWDNQSTSPLLLAAQEEKWDLVKALLTQLKTREVPSIGMFSQYYKMIRLDTIDAYPEIISELKELQQSLYVTQFKRIYNALYNGQSSTIRSINQWDKKLDLTPDTFLNYAAAHPHSRTAKAVALLNAYCTNEDFPALVREIHEYGRKRSSPFGLFKYSENKAGLEHNDTFEETFEKADEKSRTGQIRNALKPRQGG